MINASVKQNELLGAKKHQFGARRKVSSFLASASEPFNVIDGVDSSDKVLETEHKKCIVSDTAIINVVNNNAPKMDPCATPEFPPCDHKIRRVLFISLWDTLATMKTYPYS